MAQSFPSDGSSKAKIPLLYKLLLKAYTPPTQFCVTCMQVAIEFIPEKNSLQIEIKREEKWSALREDFMMGAKMKDWDKESDEEEETEAT